MANAFRTLLLSLTFALFLTGCNARNLHFIGENGQSPLTYRTSQLPEYELRSILARYNIDVIINLWGLRKKDTHRYLKEKAVAKELGIEYHDMQWSSFRYPSKEILLAFIEVLNLIVERDMNLLIHCKGGIDRTGLGSAIIRLVMYNASLKNAITMLDPEYGFSCFNNCELKVVILPYANFEAIQTFEEWVKTNYTPVLPTFGSYEPPESIDIAATTYIKLFQK